MKLLISILFLFNFSLQAQIVEEEVLISTDQLKSVEALMISGNLTIDHVGKDYFELYGPFGLKQFLDQNGISYFETFIDQNNLVGYPSYEDLTKKLKQLAAKYSSFMHLFSIGKSVQGRDLWMMKISDNVMIDEVEPEFKYISSMHGDEIVGRELTVRLIEEMGEEYLSGNPRIQDLINNTEIFIMPSMNPDGSERPMRGNANRVDLNRNFPEFVNNDQNSWTNRQPETKAVMQFQAERNFSLSANFHGGAEVVNYPWDATYQDHPHLQSVIDLSLAYANLNPSMRNSSSFPRGIVNGADWYIVKGGMQDWSERFYGDLQVTVELSNTKYPAYSTIAGYYQENRESLLEYIKLIHQGIGINLKDKNASGEISIYDLDRNIDIGSFSFRNGEYYKVLNPGQYELIIKNNKKIKKVKVQVQENFIAHNGAYLKLD